MEATCADAAASTAPLDPSDQTSPTNATANGNSVTEDEAALYDRQIRLWGLAAQTRLRCAHILILGWNGIATEIIKNTVLSGIGSITILDPTCIDGSVDLLSGFFFRDEEVGQPKCSQGPLGRVRALNPLVKVNGIADMASYTKLMQGGKEAQAWIMERGVDVVVAGTPLPEESGVAHVGSRASLVKLNETTRSAGVKFFFSATCGFGGFYFADQITHDYLLEKAAPPPTANSTTSSDTSETQRVKKRQNFVPLSSSLATKWHLSERQQRRTRIPLDWFIWLALTDLETRLAPDSALTTLSSAALKERTEALIREKGLVPNVILANHEDSVFDIVAAQGAMGVALSPVAAVVGGILSQDILNSIGGREEPVVNWLFLNMDASGATTVHRIGELPSAVVVD